MARDDAVVAINQDRFVQPYSTMLAAILVICASECVRGLRA